MATRNTASRTRFRMPSAPGATTRIRRLQSTKFVLQDGHMLINKLMTPLDSFVNRLLKRLALCNASKGKYILFSVSAIRLCRMNEVQCFSLET